MSPYRSDQAGNGDQDGCGGYRRRGHLSHGGEEEGGEPARAERLGEEGREGRCVYDLRYPEASDPGPRRVSAVARSVHTSAAARDRISAPCRLSRGPHKPLVATSLACVLQKCGLEHFVQPARVPRATYGDATMRKQDKVR
ncbi:unnamed protein product [Ectocarpus sp. 12 AP-2014]